jgi:hypothetical protein
MTTFLDDITCAPYSVLRAPYSVAVLEKSRFLNEGGSYNDMAPRPVDWMVSGGGGPRAFLLWYSRTPLCSVDSDRLPLTTSNIHCTYHLPLSYQIQTLSLSSQQVLPLSSKTPHSHQLLRIRPYLVSYRGVNGRTQVVGALSSQRHSSRYSALLKSSSVD